MYFKNICQSPRKNMVPFRLVVRFSLGKYSVQQISAHICERGGGFVEVYSFLAEKKKKLFHRFTHRLNVCLFRWITVLPVFNLTHFDRLPAHFRKCSDTQLTRGFCFFSTGSSCRQASSRPSPATYPHRPLKL